VKEGCERFRKAAVWSMAAHCYAKVGRRLGCSMARSQPRSTRLPYTTLFRSRISGSDVARSVVRTRVGTMPPSHSTTRSARGIVRSEEHTSELQSREKLVCRLLLDKKRAGKVDIRSQGLSRLRSWPNVRADRT